MKKVSFLRAASLIAMLSAPAIALAQSGVRPDVLVRFDPKTETFQSFPIASGNIYAGIHRNGHVTRDGQSLLIHQSATNYIMKVTPKPPAVR